MQATIKTNKGDIKLDLFADKAKMTVTNFVNLSKRGFYSKLTFHRVIDDFMIQGGCPIGTGTGDPGYKFKDEFHGDLKHDKPMVVSFSLRMWKLPGWIKNIQYLEQFLIAIAWM